MKEELIKIKPVGLKDEVTLHVKEDLRPRTCPDLDCKPILRGWASSDEDLHKGFSGMCYGYAGKKEWKYKEADHLNDFNVCVMTPFKGHIKFVQNFNDIANTFANTSTMIQWLLGSKCNNCGVIHPEQKITHYGSRENAYCQACAVMLGFQIYDKKTKKYKTNWDKIKSHD